MSTIATREIPKSDNSTLDYRQFLNTREQWGIRVIFQASDRKVAQFVGETLERGNGKWTQWKIVIGKILSIDGNEERAIANAKGDLKELATHKRKFAFSFLVVRGIAVPRDKQRDSDIEYRIEYLHPPVVLTLI